MKIDKRKIIQLTIGLLYNLHLVGFKDATIYTGELKKVCVPGLNCYSCPGAIAACPLGSLQNQIMNAKGLNGIIVKFPFYIIGMLVLFGTIFGRVICGFLCPFGLIQELLYKIKSFKIRKNELTRKLSAIKYIILALFVIALPIVLNSPSFCKYICPAGTFEAGLTHVLLNEKLKNTIGFLFSWKVLIMVIIFVASIFIYRIFCRFICPLGAIYSFFNKVSILGLKVDSAKCINCNACIDSCLMDVKKVGDRECIECGDCIKKCKCDAIYRIKKME